MIGIFFPLISINSLSESNRRFLSLKKISPDIFVLLFLGTNCIIDKAVIDFPEPLSPTREYDSPLFISNVLPLEEDERVTSFLPVDEYKDGHYILMATRNGVVKKTVLKAFEKKYAPGLRAINLDDGDKLIGTVITNGSDEICLASESGKAIRFNETDVRPMGRSTRGVKGLNIHKEDKVLSLIHI